MNFLFVQDFAVQELVYRRPVKTMSGERLKIVDADDRVFEEQRRFARMTKDVWF